MIAEKVLFVSDGQYVDSAIKGGVQLCTHEYLRYIVLAGYEPILFKVERNPGIITKLKIKLGIDAYELYQIQPYLKELIDVLGSSAIKLVFFNQLNLAAWTDSLKTLVADDVKFVGLSHGNESADYLHDISKRSTPTKVQTWRLGRLLLQEAKLFSNTLDGVIVLNEDETAINKWLGVKQVLYLPRLLDAEIIAWHPINKVVGFVGTLDHLPNRLGIELLAKELARLNFEYVLKLVGGPLNSGKELASQYNFIHYLGPLSEEQLLKEVTTWSVFLNPVFWHSRGASTKLALAIKWGIPCVTSQAGKRGYSLSDYSIVTEDDAPETFAKMLISALENESYLQKLKIATENNAKNFDTAPWITKLKRFLFNLSNRNS